MKTQRVLLTTALILCVSLPLLALPKTMLFCLPGFPGSTEQAQPYVDRMLRFLEIELGATAGSMTGTYLPDGGESSATLLSGKPELAVVGPSVYAQHAKSMKMKVIAQVEANGRGDETYYVVVRKDGPASLDGLAGAAVAGVVVHDEKYVYNVILDRQLKAGSLTLSDAKRPMKALRDLAQGKIKAVIVDRSVHDSLKELEFAADLKVIYTSKPVPAPAVVVMGGGVGSAEQIKKALVGLCGKPEGKELCKALTISSIKAATDADYRGLMKRYLP